MFNRRNKAQKASVQLGTVAVPAPRTKDLVPIADVEKFLVQLLDGVSRKQFDDRNTSYSDFYEKMSQLSMQLSLCSSVDEKFHALQETLYEIHRYQRSEGKESRSPELAWRTLAATALCALFTPVDAKRLSACDDRFLGETKLQELDEEIDDFESSMSLRPQLSGGNADCSEEWKRPFSTDLNPTRLKDGAELLGRLEQLINNHKVGYIIVFRLSCLDIVGERFGWDAVVDSVGAVSDHLSESMKRYGEVFYWNDSTLLAVVETRAPEKALTRSILQLINGNRDIFVQVGNHLVLLRMPLVFHLLSIADLASTKQFCKVVNQVGSDSNPHC